MSTAVRIALTFLSGIIIFLGLPFIAWGITDMAGFIEHPARLTYVILVIVLNAFAALRMPEVGKKREGQKTMVQRQHMVVVLLQIISLAIVLVGPYCDRRGLAFLGDRSVVRWLGLALYGIGFLFMHFAEVYLGRQFSVEVAIREGHRLITDGPYRYLRHPRYVGIILFAAGLALVCRSWIGLLLTLLTGVVLFWRIRDEEDLMRREFGGEWEEYVRRTWRLVPGLW